MGASRLPKYAPQPLRRAPRVDAPPVVARAPSQGTRWPWPHSPRLADILAPERNSFGVLRLMLALAVVVSHAFFLASGRSEAEPLFGLTGYSLGHYGVQGFFMLSGLLVAQSLVTRGNLWDYGRARALRIFPALIACVLVTAVIVGPGLSYFGPHNYIMSTGWLEYIVKTLSLSTGSAQLPGVFALNPAGSVVNQSLWSLKYEVACYLILGGLAAFVAQFQRSPSLIGALMAAWAGTMLWLKPGLFAGADFATVLAYFALFFGTGVAAYLLRDRIRISWQPLPVLALLFVVTWHTDLAEITSAAFVGYGLLWLATHRFGGLRAYTNAHDYSYGVYIYSFPVTQALLSVWPGLNLVSLMAATLGITLGLAFLSWELIERPALSLVRGWRKAPVQAPVEAKPAQTKLMQTKPVQANAVSVPLEVAAPAAEIAAAEFMVVEIAAAVAPTPAAVPPLPEALIDAASAVRAAATPTASHANRDARLLKAWLPKPAPAPTLRRKPVEAAPVVMAPVGDRLQARIAKIAAPRTTPTQH
jgi:peptidoglycan/LPS O-acetylase OafA/YrhL